MARQVRWGTPGKSDHYPPLRRPGLFLGPSLLLGAAALGLLLLSWAVGFRTPVAPGAVIGSHATIEARCEECHTSRRGVSDVRCPRCPDPSGGGRLNNAAHGPVGSRGPKQAP